MFHYNCLIYLWKRPRVLRKHLRVVSTGITRQTIDISTVFMLITNINALYIKVVSLFNNRFSYCHMLYEACVKYISVTSWRLNHNAQLQHGCIFLMLCLILLQSCLHRDSGRLCSAGFAPACRSSLQSSSSELHRSFALMKCALTYHVVNERQQLAV